MPAALAIPLIIGSAYAGTKIASAKMGSDAAKDAAKAQTNSANYAASLEKQSADNSLAFQKQEYADQQKNLAPYLAQGKTSLAAIGKGVAPGGEFTKTFGAADMANDPGYQFRLAEGQKALERAQAAGGSVGSGGALKEAQAWGQNYASNEYSNARGRFVDDQTNRFNRLATLAGVGQTATQTSASAGNAAAGNIASINSSAARGMGDAAMAAGNATASGYIGSANAWSSGLSGIGDGIMNSALLYQMMKGKG